MKDFAEGDLWGIALIDDEDETCTPIIELSGLTTGELQMALDSWPDDELAKDRCSICFGRVIV